MTDPYAEQRAALYELSATLGGFLVRRYADRIAEAHRRGDSRRASELARLVADEIARINGPIAVHLSRLPPPPIIVAIKALP